MKVIVERILLADKTKKGTPIYQLLVKTNVEGDQGSVITAVANNGNIKQDAIIDITPTKRDTLYFANIGQKSF